MKRAFHMHAQFLVGLCVIFFPAHGLSVSVDDARAKAYTRSLAEHPMWWTLGHYHKKFGAVVSRIDDESFFLSPNGKTNPASELDATIRSMFQVWEPETTNDTRSVACRFPARWAWLKQELSIPDSALPEPDCEEYLQVVKHLNPRSITVVYPAAYMNSPASMFGHLLLAIDSTERSRLLSKAVNYAAAVETGFGPIFAFNGIFGLYQGAYAIVPYYDKVEEYSSVSKRDIWEYELELTEQELDRVLRHIWELQNIWSRYFFFKENCAFNLLYPIEAARPGLRLTQSVGLHATPVDMLRKIIDAGLVKNRSHRPSQFRVLRELYDRNKTEPSELSSLMFEIEWLKYQYTEEQITPEAYREAVFPLMRRRAKLGKAQALEIAEPAPPEDGHRPARIHFAAGHRNSEGTMRLGIRAVHHDWLDPTTGFEPGAYIRFFSGQLEYASSRQKFIGGEFTLVNVESYNIQMQLNRSASWSFRLGGDRADLQKRSNWVGCDASSGVAFGKQSCYGFIMWDNRLGVDHSSVNDGVWQTGARAGMLLDASPFQLGLKHRSITYIDGNHPWEHSTTGSAMYEIDRNLSVGVEFSRLQRGSESVDTTYLTYSKTF